MVSMSRSKNTTLHICFCCLAMCLAERLLDHSSGETLCKVMDCAKSVCLGKGAFGHVFRVESCNDYNLRIAVKIALKRADLATAEFKAMVDLSWMRMPNGASKPNMENIELPIWAETGTILSPYILTPLVFDYVKVKVKVDHLEIVPAIAMELADSDLLEVIYKNKWAEVAHPSTNVEVKKAWTLFHILQGVKHMQSNEYIHRDLKPENIMFVQGVPKIGDLGLACKHGKTCRGIAGTPLYMPPEIYGVGNIVNTIDYKNDMWSVGVIVFEILFKRIPKKELAAEKDDYCLARWPFKEAMTSPLVKAIEESTQAKIDALIDGQDVRPGWKRLLRGLLQYKTKNRYGVDQAIRKTESLLQDLQLQITPHSEARLAAMPSPTNCENEDPFDVTSSDSHSNSNGSASFKTANGPESFKTANAYSNPWATERFGTAMETLYWSLVSPVLDA